MSLSIATNMQTINNLQTKKISSDLQLDLQKGIKEGNLDSITKIIKHNGDAVRMALPNGELPLHFAVREGKAEIVTLLLKQGADPEAKDFQHLSAIDHAVLMKNETIFAHIVGHKIGKDLKDVQEQMKCKGSSAHVNQLKIEVQKISNLPRMITPLALAAYTGNCEILLKLPKHNINLLDENGLSPLHYAILGNKPQAIEKLLDLGAEVNLLSRDGQSPAHFAAAAGSHDALAKLIALRATLNHANAAGQTPLHYAAAREDLKLVEILVKNGANPHLLDKQGMSPLTLIGASAYQRDPLGLPKAQVVLFATASLYWISNMALAGGWVASEEGKIYAALTMFGASVAMNWSEFAVLITNLDKSWKKVLAYIGFFGLRWIPPFNIPFQAWSTYNMAKAAFSGFKSCWRNAGYRNWSVARNIVVYSANTANSAHTLYAHCLLTHEIALHASYIVKIALAKDEETMYQIYEEYLEFLRCPPVDPKKLTSLSTIERLNEPKLEPECPKHALMMMSPEFTMEQLKTQGDSLYKRTYRQMMLEIHPDKVKSDPSTLQATTRLGSAAATLKTWVEKHKTS